TGNSLGANTSGACGPCERRTPLACRPGCATRKRIVGGLLRAALRECDATSRLHRRGCVRRLFLSRSGVVMRRTIFYVSDGTGITAETIGHSVLTQFDSVDFDSYRIPFVADEAAAHAAAARIRRHFEQTGHKPIVVNTIMSQSLSDIVARHGALLLGGSAPFV